VKVIIDGGLPVPYSMGMDINSKFKAACRSRGWNRTRAAARLGCCEATIAGLWRDKRPGNGRLLAAIEREFHIQAADWYSDAAEVPKCE